MSKKQEKQNLSEFFPWWIFATSILSGILFGAIGAVVLFTSLYGYWYLWRKTVFSIPMKIIFSVAPVVIVIGIIYVFSLGFFVYDDYKKINQEMDSHNIEISKNAGRTTLNNNEYQFSITYPPNWERDAVFRENIILQLKLDDKRSSITIKEFDTEFSTHQEYLEYATVESLKTAFKQTKGINLIKIEESTLDGLKIFKIYYTEDTATLTGTQQFEVMTIEIIRNNGKKLGINFVAYPNDFDLHIDEATTIINTLNFQ